MSKKIVQENLEWSDKFKIGYHKIDDVHEKMFYLINRIQTAKEEYNDPEFVSSIIKDFEDYAYSHFLEEEELMRQTYYPNYIEHKKNHQSFREHIKDNLILFKKNKLNIEEFIIFSKNWLVNHFLNEDMKFIRHIDQINICRADNL